VQVNTYGLDLAGWTLTGAVAVSADGSTVVGYGTGPSGAQEGWIAVIPRPNVQIAIEQQPIALNSPPIPVAVLGSSTVDVTQIDVTTLHFGPKGATAVSTQIVSATGQVNLVVSFNVQDTGLAIRDTQGCLQGTIGGEFF